MRSPAPGRWPAGTGRDKPVPYGGWFDSTPVRGYVSGDEASCVWMPRIRIALLVGGWCLAGSVAGSEVDWRQHRDAGLAAYRQGDHAEAVSRTESALAEAAAFGERDTRFAETLANLAFLYREAGRPDDSERAFLRSVFTWEAIVGEDHEIVGQTLNNLGSLYDAEGRFDEAEPLFRARGRHRRKNPRRRAPGSRRRVVQPGPRLPGPRPS